MKEFKTLLVDAPYLLKRSIFGAKDGYTRAGYIGGLYQFMTTLRKLIKTYSPNKVILFWDGKDGGFYRYKLDKKYKANRDKQWRAEIVYNDEQKKLLNDKRESEILQKEKIQQYAEELYIRQIEVERIEADDLIAYYIMRHKDDEEMILYTNDRDYLQLLDYGVTIHYDNLEWPVDKHNYFNFFPFYYKNALTMKIICGDTADNVDGIQGIGHDTLFKHFPELKEKEFKVRDVLLKTKLLKEERETQKKKPLKVFENLLGGIERLKLNYELMNLHEPILTDEAMEALDQLEAPLAEEDQEGNKRGSAALRILMERDDFLSLYSNFGNFTNYVQPFFGIILKEKENLKKYLSENQ